MPHSVPVHFLNYSRYSDSFINSNKAPTSWGKIKFTSVKNLQIFYISSWNCFIYFFFFLQQIKRKHSWRDFYQGSSGNARYIYIHKQSCVILHTQHNHSATLLYLQHNYRHKGKERKKINKSTFSQIILILNARMNSVNVYCAQACDPRLART